MSLAERIRTLFHEQSITIFSILTALPMTISTTFLSITGVFGGVGGGGGGDKGLSTKRQRTLEKMVRQVSRFTQKTSRKSR